MRCICPWNRRSTLARRLRESRPPAARRFGCTRGGKSPGRARGEKPCSPAVGARYSAKRRPLAANEGGTTEPFRPLDAGGSLLLPQGGICRELAEDAFPVEPAGANVACAWRGFVPASRLGAQAVPGGETGTPANARKACGTCRRASGRADCVGFYSGLVTEKYEPFGGIVYGV